MSDRRCRTRIITRAGTTYMLFEDMENILEQLDEPFVKAVSWTGSDLMPPEPIAVRSSEIVSVQTMTFEAWVWSKQATELHYARQMSDLEKSPGADMASAMSRLVAMMERESE